MKYIEFFSFLTPFFLVLFSVIIIININIFFLKKLGFLHYPYNGLEWSQVIWSSSYLLGLIIINLSLVYPTIQTFRFYKTIKTEYLELIKSIWPHFSLFLFSTFILSLIYFISSFIILISFPNEKKSVDEIKGGNIPLSILTSFIMIGISILFFLFSNMFLENLIPFSITIR